MTEPIRILARLKTELEWLEKNTIGVSGERAAARESWCNVGLYLDRLHLALVVGGGGR